MRSIYSFCKGVSHEASGKPCQDYAYAEHTSSLSMAIVSDGHGGERYFRSDVGSKAAVEITVRAVKQFVKDVDPTLFAGHSFTEYKQTSATDAQFRLPEHKAMIWLFSSIISQWNNAIIEDAMTRDLTTWEKEHVPQEYQDLFVEARCHEESSFEKTYGCTLMAYVQTDKYWFAFHIGDGKCVSLGLQDGMVVDSQPIPWDDDCFLNKTTSLCNSDALERFRYCYEGDGKFPLAVFLGSDGIDDTFGDGDALTEFYIKLYKQIAKSGEATAKEVLVRNLPLVSRAVSKDDCSVACIYDETKLEDCFEKMIAWQQGKIAKNLAEAQQKQDALIAKINQFGNLESLDQKASIDYQYAVKNLDKAKLQIKKAYAKLADLKKELAAYQNRPTARICFSAKNKSVPKSHNGLKLKRIR